MLPKEHHVQLLNLGTTINLQMIKLNPTLVELVAIDKETLFRNIRTFLHGIIPT
jgi:D-mannonate dehydratase